MENIRSQLNLFKDCKAPCIVFAEVTDSIQGNEKKPLSKRPQLEKNDWVAYCKKINEIAKRLEDEEMPLAYHHHMGTVIETQQDTERLLENTSDQVKLILDTGHMLFAGGNSIEVANNFKERVIHVHCKDIRKNVLEKSLKQNFSFRQALFSFLTN